LNWDDFLESWRAGEVDGYSADELEHVVDWDQDPLAD
jgi:hypothetical protein